ncbi:MAG: hypothetical protein K9J13_00295 [Saprospiraceae bacterium]|nr:hypothetical protein [Saprospiraceae bacterium]
MKFSRITIFAIVLLATVALVFTACIKEEVQTPTNELMQGVWELTQVTENDSNITSQFTGIFPTFIHLDDMNSVNSTAGPLFMYIVYGKSKFINITSQIDNVFNYSNLSFTSGEWFIDKNEVVDNFTIEMKLKFPTTSTITTLLDAMGVSLGGVVDDILDAIIYHKFRNVRVEINDDDPETMIWEFDDLVIAEYNTKDSQGDYVLYQGTGFGVDSYSRCRLVFKKKVKTLTQLAQEQK